jgi:hypothetical protein
MAGVDFNLNGITPLRRKLNGQFANVRDGTLAAVEKPVRAIMADSAQQVPRDTESMANSAYMTSPRFEGDSVVIEFGYGGPNAQVNPRTGQNTDEYAYIVHEDLTANHPNGKAKFLEDPINTHAPNILTDLGGDISKFFG